MAWQAGEVILWCYRREVLPVRVVQDGECLVVWVAPGTPILRAVPTDGRAQRDRPVEERFVCDMEFALASWFGAGTLRVSYPGEAHSSWLFRRPDDHEQFWGWYGNLEDPLWRDTNRVHTYDHVLDVWLDADGKVGWKDEDELAAAVAVGKFTTDDERAIRAHGEKVFAAMQRRDPPYDGSWLDWRPDPLWGVPELPDEYLALVGTPAEMLFERKV